MSNSEPEKRPIRSFVVRSGRLTDSQRKAIDQHWDSYVIEYQPRIISPAECFDSPAPLTVEIGFGMGDSLLEMATDQPTKNFLGIEVHQPGLGKLLHGINERGLTNLKMVCHDAVEVMQHCFEENSIARMQIFFPDPWHKKRHHKRRLIQPEFTRLLASRLQVNGALHLATDWEHYAEHMVEVLEAEPALRNVNDANQYWLNPERPQTKFERRGERLGHGVWDLLYEKVSV